jgi:glycosyltransferase involved in cell wall biosynthesis
MTQSDTERPNDIVAIVPCYNAGARVRPVVEGILEHIDHVTVVDDGCTDDSMATLSDLPADIVSLPENRGKGHALLAGFQAALKNPDTACVCVLDADGQHDPRELPRLYAAFRETGADLVIGSRVFDGAHVPLRSRFGNKVTVTVTALLLRHHLPDTQSGFRLLSRPFVESILTTVEGGRYETEMEIIVKAIREGRKTVPIPISTIYETGNASSHFRKFHDSFRIYTRLLRAAWFTRHRG